MHACLCLGAFAEAVVSPALAPLALWPPQPLLLLLLPSHVRELPWGVALVACVLLGLGVLAAVVQAMLVGMGGSSTLQPGAAGGSLVPMHHSRLLLAGWGCAAAARGVAAATGWAPARGLGGLAVLGGSTALLQCGLAHVLHAVLAAALLAARRRHPGDATAALGPGLPAVLAAEAGAALVLCAGAACRRLLASGGSGSAAMRGGAGVVAPALVRAGAASALALALDIRGRALYVQRAKLSGWQLGKRLWGAGRE